jgi:heat shock protein HslJ
MACTNGMEIERQIHEMFPRVTGWKISGETLQLTDANRTPVATFESRYMK